MTASVCRRVSLSAISSSIGDRAFRCVSLAAATFLFALAVGCGSDDDGLSPNHDLKISSIVIDSVGPLLERGTVVQLTATVRDTADKIVSVPVAWRSDVDSIASVDRNGVLTANDTGITTLRASALGVQAQPIAIRVVWFGAAKAAAFQFTAPNAVTPGAVFGDSIRILVTNLAGGSVPDALVKFSANAGGSVSAPVVKTNANGLATVQWTFGPDAAANTLTATVVKADSATLIPWVEGNPISLTVTTYAALTVVGGDGQTGQILSPLTTAPSVKLVDANGSPRAGVPITFSPTANGKVTSPVISTGADGVASPGSWTLGDAPGDEQLVVTVENARLVMHATATGTPTYFAATQVGASAGATCARTADELVSCLGASALTGRDESSPRSTPGATSGGVHFKNVVGGDSHFCGVGTDLAIYCWGTNALVDTTGVVVSTTVPTKMASTISWQQVTPGGSHNCGLAADQTAFCWGFNANGQLGDGGTSNHAAPRAVGGGFHFSGLAAGTSHECGLAVDGSIYCWGANASGQLGDGSTTDRHTPTVVSTADKFTAIGAGGNWTCGLNATGGAECWGAGTGHATPQTYANAPSFTSIAVGTAHACALTSDGTAYCWGDNSVGQLGDSTKVARQAPTAVATALRFSSISAGVAHTCGITTDGSAVCWGANQSGELGFAPPPTVQLTPRFVVLGVQP
jgi:alpha-tubulin suppressor-like RCC1 family protein